MVATKDREGRCATLRVLGCRRRVYLLSAIGFGPGVLLLQVAFRNEVLSMTIAAIVILILTGLGISTVLMPCPRCGKEFFGASTMYILRRACTNCGLSLSCAKEKLRGGGDSTGEGSIG